jgi:hypothetical protein
MVCTKCEKVYQCNLSVAQTMLIKLRNSPRSPRPIHLNRPLLASRTARAKSARTNSSDAQSRQEQVPALVGVSPLRVQRIVIRFVWRPQLETCAGPDVQLSQPYAGKCKDCKQSVTQNQAKYCHSTSTSLDLFRPSSTWHSRLCVQKGNLLNMWKADIRYIWVSNGE